MSLPSRKSPPSIVVIDLYSPINMHLYIYIYTHIYALFYIYYNMCLMIALLGCFYPYLQERETYMVGSHVLITTCIWFSCIHNNIYSSLMFVYAKISLSNIKSYTYLLAFCQLTSLEVALFLF